MNADVRVTDDPAQAAAELLVAAGGHVALTGGSTPRSAYERAATLREDWSGVDFWFTDERCVPPDHEHSNFGMADRALLSRLSRPPRVMRIQGELGFEAAAGAYDALLREQLGPRPRFDFILLGVGPDGHVASLFPGKPELEETERLAAPVPIAYSEQIRSRLASLAVDGVTERTRYISASGKKVHPSRRISFA